MTSTSEYLIAAVRAALDDTERIALAAMRGPWRCHYIAADDAWQLSGTSDPYGIARLRNDGVNEGTVRHIALHDPAAVLRDVAADREILDEYAVLHLNPERLHDPVLHLVYNLLAHIVRVRARGLGIDPRDG